MYTIDGYTSEYEEHDDDCECMECHRDWHNPLVDWAVCNVCKEIVTELNEIHNQERERGVHGG